MRKLLAIITLATLSLGAEITKADGHSGNVVLINTFTVPVTAVDEAIEMWEMARDFLKDQPGYVSTKLQSPGAGCEVPTDQCSRMGKRRDVQDGDRIDAERSRLAPD